MEHKTAHVLGKQANLSGGNSGLNNFDNVIVVVVVTVAIKISSIVV